MEPHILIIEPFYGGSHKQLIDVLQSEIEGCVLHSMTAKKWHWRSRTSALHLAGEIPQTHTYQTLFCSSILPLHDLLALRPDLTNLHKIVYFHENQLIYPVRNRQDGDFQYGYNQILTCLAADKVLFNSEFNMQSFLSSIDGHLSLMPDYRPKGLDARIKERSTVLYFPLEFPLIAREKLRSVDDPLHIVWPHRWEHDKGPDDFFSAMNCLMEDNFHFKVIVIGESFSETPSIFETMKEKLADRVAHWGYLPSKEDYYETLKQADVVVSTACHEFFGVAM